jgi:hypothetical protein
MPVFLAMTQLSDACRTKRLSPKRGVICNPKLSIRDRCAKFRDAG